MPIKILNARFKEQGNGAKCHACKDPETVTHMLLHCPWYNDLCQTYLTPYLVHLSMKSDTGIVCDLLAAKGEDLVQSTAIYLQLVIQRGTAVSGAQRIILQHAN